MLIPRLEEWILSGAKGAGVDVRKYNLPDDPKSLHEEINLNLEKFERLDSIQVQARLLYLLGRVEEKEDVH